MKQQNDPTTQAAASAAQERSSSRTSSEYSENPLNTSFSDQSLEVAEEVGNDFDYNYSIELLVDEFRGCLYESRENEIELLKALRGSGITQIGDYEVHTDYSDSETVVAVISNSQHADHKYVMAKDYQDHTYVVAAPMFWTGFHADIVERIQASQQSYLECLGGGYIKVNEDSSVDVYSKSVQYGEGDHSYAKNALERALEPDAEEELGGAEETKTFCSEPSPAEIRAMLPEHLRDKVGIISKRDPEAIIASIKEHFESLEKA